MRFSSGSYRSGYLLKNITEIEDWITKTWLEKSLSIADESLQKDMKKRVEDASLGRNTVLIDDANMPSIMVKFEPKEEASLGYLYDDSSDGVHPAFVIDGDVKPFWHGKYHAGRVNGVNYGVSLRGLQPAHYIDFDEAVALCTGKGTGWHLSTNAEWAYIALLSIRKGFECRGNTNYGRHHAETDEWGIGTTITEGYAYRHTLTGSGPRYWSHDGTPFGVFDMVGNVWNWVSGFRIVDGEIQILPNNNAAGSLRTTAAHAVDSIEWKALLLDGTLVSPEASLDAWLTGTAYVIDDIRMHNGVRYKAISDHTSDSTTEPGTGASWETVWEREGTLHYIYDGSVRLGDAALGLTSDSKTITFSSLETDGIISIPDIAKTLLLAPRTAAPTGTLWVRDAERFPLRGGARYCGGTAGIGALTLYYARGNSSYGIGLCPAYVE